MGVGWVRLFFEEWGYVGEDVGGYDSVACGGGVGAVALHHSWNSEDVLEEEWEQGYVVFVANDGVGVGELFDVVGAVVGGEGDAGEDYFGAAGFEGLDDVVEVGAGVGDGEAAEAVVAAELDYDDGRVEGEDGAEALDSVLGGVAADAFVDDAVMIARGVEVGLEIVGIALAGVGAEAGG
jgi:hypothetical protein